MSFCSSMISPCPTRYFPDRYGFKPFGEMFERKAREGHGEDFHSWKKQHGLGKYHPDKLRKENVRYRGAWPENSPEWEAEQGAYEAATERIADVEAPNMDHDEYEGYGGREEL